MTDDLKDDHDRIRTLLAELEAMIDANQPPVDHRLTDLRHAIFDELREHIVRESAMIEQSFGDAVIARARRYVVDHIEKQAAEQLRVWTGATIRTAWNGYRAETASFVRRLRTHMDDEEAMIAALF